MTATQRRLAAIMFSDIVGYSKLMGQDEAGTLALLQEHNALLIPIIQRHRGSVLKFIGDAILSSFDSAADAVHCAVDIQKALGQRNKNAAKAILVRIGVHIGDITEQGGEIIGDGVNIAARIQPLAEPGGICISQTVYHVVRAQPEIRVQSMGERELKNISENIHIYKVQVSDAPPASSRKTSAALILSAAALLIAGAAAWRLLQMQKPAAPPAPSAPATPPKQAMQAAQTSRAPHPAAAPTVSTPPQRKPVVKPDLAAGPDLPSFADGHRYEAQGDTRRAAKHYRGVLDAEPDSARAAWAALYYHAAALRVGSTKNSDRALLSLLERAGDQGRWPLPLVSLFAGKTSVEDVLGRAQEPSQACQARYFLGIRALLAAEARDTFLPSKASRGRARAFFEQAAQLCADTTVIGRQSRLELERLGR